MKKWEEFWGHNN